MALFNASSLIGTVRIETERFGEILVHVVIPGTVVRFSDPRDDETISDTNTLCAGHHAFCTLSCLPFFGLSVEDFVKLTTEVQNG